MQTRTFPPKTFPSERALKRWANKHPVRSYSYQGQLRMMSVHFDLKYYYQLQKDGTWKLLFSLLPIRDGKKVPDFLEEVQDGATKKA